MADGGQLAISGYKPGSKQNRALTATDKSKEQLATEIIERYLDGQDTSVQARALGVTRQRLSKLLLEAAPEEWKAAQTARAWIEYEEAKADLQRAGDAIDLSRARERCRFATWELSTLSRVFAQTQQQSSSSVSISINLQGHSEREPVSIEAQAIDPE